MSEGEYYKDSMNSVKKPSTVLVIFGITGDLSKRKLLPALLELMKAGEISPDSTSIIGVTRRDVSTDDLLADAKIDSTEWGESFRQMISMHKMDLVDEADYHKLAKFLEEGASTTTQFLYYLSMPPEVFGPVIDNLGAAGLNGSRHRLLVEKPFGFDLQTAEELIHRIGAQYEERQVYRIDHYLAKETAQNILTFRFSNPLFATIWNRQNIDRIIINASESIGIEGRGIFYEQTGALRDLIQSHLLQLLALVTMEEPQEMTSAAIHHEKLRLLLSLEPISRDKIDLLAVRGQYEGYKEDAQSPHSQAETFAALRLQIDNERWQGVPMILQTGKALAQKETAITVVFKDPTSNKRIDNHLVITLQPNEGIGLSILAKKPGLDYKTELVEMDFRYDRAFEDRHPEAYERVLVDAIRGDQTLFASGEEVLASWRAIQSVIQTWSQGQDDIPTYPRGSQASELAAKLLS